VPKILAVDDSVTMRRVLELTFRGLDGFEVVTFDSGEQAFAHAQGSGADLVIADASMSPDGYDLCQRLKSGGATASIPVLILGSQHHAIDADKAKAAGADDTALKPYDTNTFVEKVKALAARGGARAPASQSAAGAQVATYRTAPQAAISPTATPTPALRAPAVEPSGKPALQLAEDDEQELLLSTPPSPAPPQPAPPVPGVIGRPAGAIPSAAKPPQRTTATFGGAAAAARPIAAPAAKPAVAPAPIATAPIATAPVATAPVAPAPVATAPVAPAPAAPPLAAATAAASAAVAPKLEGLGLTAEQVAAVVSLTREVVERVVWEVVPDLAETIIREEIRRLTK
jgi:CheY-like chemotaxis protein